MKKVIFVSCLVVTLVGSTIGMVYVKAYKDGRCDYAKARFAKEASEELQAQKDRCFYFMAGIGQVDTQKADAACNEWLHDKVEPAVNEYFAEEAKKISCN